MSRNGLLCVLSVVAITMIGTGAAVGQDMPARALVEQAADAMGGIDRVQGVQNFVMSGFGQEISQLGGGNPSPAPHAPSKWQAVNAAERYFDLRAGLARREDRRSNLFPFAIERGHSWALSREIQSGAATLDHPLTAVRAALDPATRLGPVRTDQGLHVVQMTVTSGETLWLALDPVTRLPAWTRWIGPSATLGDIAYTAWFTGYLPFDGLRLPTGLTTTIDWRDTTIATQHVDSYAIDIDEFPAIDAPASSGPREPAEADVTRIADGVWDVRVGSNGGAVIEFSDHLTMFEAYGSEAATFARIDAANRLVPGKQVSEVIVSHHHFDHSGGLRAAVARGLAIISHRGNREIFEEMIARPAPNYPDALAREPKPLEFVAVDEHLRLDDGTMRVDVYHAIGHLHMANAVFAYVPEYGVFLEGDFTTHDWDLHWWGGAYLDNVEHYGLDPEINVPVHGIVTTFDETIAAIERQVSQARDFCARNRDVGVYLAGCPVRYSRDTDR